MARLGTFHNRKLDLKKPLIVRKRFKANGRVLEPGHIFLWYRLAINTRRVMVLFQGRFIDHEEYMGDVVAEIQTEAEAEAALDKEVATVPQIFAEQGEADAIVNSTQEVEENASITPIVKPDVSGWTLAQLKDFAKEKGLPVRRAYDDQLAEVQNYLTGVQNG
jgi:hypothetical protein